ncbi:MAG: hypothetical protein CME93_03300 [Hyphomonadaceae bacterium]|nr:hypothetical protein [Hyphomonadaceae bacterium]OUX94431.1 MAG: hypothetical protein CBB77_04885 [Hyphomonas sp. TMED17]
MIEKYKTDTRKDHNIQNRSADFSVAAIIIPDVNPGAGGAICSGRVAGSGSHMDQFFRRR